MDKAVETGTNEVKRLLAGYATRTQPAQCSGLMLLHDKSSQCDKDFPSKRSLLLEAQLSRVDVPVTCPKTKGIGMSRMIWTPYSNHNNITVSQQGSEEVVLLSKDRAAAIDDVLNKLNTRLVLFRHRHLTRQRRHSVQEQQQNGAEVIVDIGKHTQGSKQRRSPLEEEERRGLRVFEPLRAESVKRKRNSKMNKHKHRKRKKKAKMKKRKV